MNHSPDAHHADWPSLAQCDHIATLKDLKPGGKGGRPNWPIVSWSIGSSPSRVARFQLTISAVGWCVGANETLNLIIMLAPKYDYDTFFWARVEVPRPPQWSKGRGTTRCSVETGEVSKIILGEVFLFSSPRCSHANNRSLSDNRCFPPLVEQKSTRLVKNWPVVVLSPLTCPRFVAARYERNSVREREMLF